VRSSCLAIALLLCATNGLLAQNSELKALKEEDLAFQLGTRKVTRSDDDRVKLVLELLAKGAAQTPEDKFNAALILQHTPAVTCGKKLVSKSFYNHLLAYHLAKESFDAGYADARELVAQTMDRYLSYAEGRQKYGTNRIFNQKTGKEELVPIDRSVPDSERAKYGIAPLVVLLKTYPELSPEQKPAARKKPGKPTR
jgi:hypothetical protein